MVKMLDDTFKSFVGEKMSKIGPEYTAEDLDLAFRLEHEIIGCYSHDEVVGFCVLTKHHEYFYVAYTWCKKTLEAKKIFIEGIRFLVSNYPDVQFIEEREPVMYRAYLKEKEKIWQQ